MYEISMVIFAALSFLIALINLIIILIDKIKSSPPPQLVKLLLLHVKLVIPVV